MTSKTKDLAAANLVIRAVLKVYGLTIRELLDHRGLESWSWARMVAMAVLRETTPLTLCQVGAIFGKQANCVSNAVTRIGQAVQRGQSVEAIEQVRKLCAKP